MNEINGFGHLLGIKVSCSDFIDRPVYRQAKPHHKHRIAKKWRKRYGMKIDHYLEGPTVKIGNAVHTGRIGYQKLREQIGTYTTSQNLT